MKPDSKITESMEQVFLCLENLGYVFPKNGDTEEPLKILEPPPPPEKYKKPELSFERKRRDKRKLPRTSPELVRKILQGRWNGASYKELRKQFGVSHWLVYNIVNNPDSYFS